MMRAMRGGLGWLTGDEAGRVVRLATGLAVLVWLLLLAYARAALAPPWGGVFLALTAATAVAAVALGPWRPGGWAGMGPRRRLGSPGWLRRASSSCWPSRAPTAPSAPRVG